MRNGLTVLISIKVRLSSCKETEGVIEQGDRGGDRTRRQRGVIEQGDRGG